MPAATELLRLNGRDSGVQVFRTTYGVLSRYSRTMPATTASVMPRVGYRAQVELAACRPKKALAMMVSASIRVRRFHPQDSSRPKQRNLTGERSKATLEANTPVQASVPPFTTIPRLLKLRSGVGFSFGRPQDGCFSASMLLHSRYCVRYVPQLPAVSGVFGGRAESRRISPVHAAAGCCSGGVIADGNRCSLPVD